jgi:hypothetical protein
MGRLRRSVPYVAGLGLGLYLARVVAEATRVAWSLPALLALATVAAVTGLALARFLTSSQGLSARPTRTSALWTALPLWLYVLWPRQDLAVTWGVGLTALPAWLMQVASGKWAGGKFAWRDDLDGRGR